MYSYKTKGTCSRKLEFDVQDGIVQSCSFENGCAGSLKAISKMVVGQPVDTVIDMLQGIQCRNGTSCPDQLAKALIQYKQEQE